MEEYNTQIERAAILISDTLWTSRRSGMETAGHRLDRLILDLVRAVGRLATEQVLGEFSQAHRIESDDYLAGIDEGVFCTVLREISAVLPRSRDRTTRKQRTPLTDLFGVVRDGKSEAVRRALTDFGCERSYGDAVEQFEEHYGIEIGRTSALRLVTAEGDRAVDFVDAKLDELASKYDAPAATRDVAEEVFVELDGSMHRTATLQPAGCIGRSDLSRDKKVRVIEWKEIRVGLAYRSGEVSPSYVAAKASYEQIRDQLFRVSV
ncbi:MAG: hypothetical protein ACJAYU_003178 [Bradymonadia bacterium]|jgi:hypothetical protein